MTLKNKKVKIYVVSNMYPSADDAYFGVFVKNFCIGIADNDQIDIIAKSVIKGQGRSFAQKFFKYLRFYLSILYNSLLQDFDIIYVHNVSHTIIPLYPILLRKIFKKFIVILNPHGEDMIITHKLDGILLKMSLPFIRKADQIVLPSNYFKSEIVELYDLNPKKMFVSASGGVDLNLFKPDCSINHFDRVSKILGFVSRIDHDKGWDTLLYAIQILVKTPEFNNLKVVFVGKGESTSEFLNMIDRLQINQHIQYLGFRSQSELPEIFNSLDAFIFPTKMHESLGLVGLEAMACGIPVIGSDRGGLNDYITNAYNGYQFECNNVASLVEKITSFYNLPDEDLLEMKKNALKTAHGFSQKKVSTDMVGNLIQIKERLKKP